MNLTPRENLRRLLDGGSPSWSPFSLDVGAIPGFTEPVLRRFREATGSDDPAAYFDTDWRAVLAALPVWRRGSGGIARGGRAGHVVRRVGHRALGGRTGGHAGTALSAAGFGGQRRASGIAAAADRSRHGADRSAVARFHAAGYPVFGYAGSIYEWSWWLRGMEQFLMDLVSEPGDGGGRSAKGRRTHDATGAGHGRGGRGRAVLLRRRRDAARHAARAGAVAAIRQAGVAERAGRRPSAFSRTCGSSSTAAARSTPIVPDIVELGFHVLHPVQPECMDFGAVYERFGRRIVLAATDFGSAHVSLRLAGRRPPGSPPAGGDSRRRPTGDLHAQQSHPAGNAVGEYPGLCRCVPAAAGRRGAVASGQWRPPRRARWGLRRGAGPMVALRQRASETRPRAHGCGSGIPIACISIFMSSQVWRFISGVRSK